MQNTELALLIDRLMRRIHFGLQAKAPEFDTAKVGPGGGIVLLTIAEMGCPGLNELTSRVARDKSQMTRTIRSLEVKGLVQRASSKTDARVSLISLTQEGQAVVRGLQSAVADTVSEILSPISKEDERIFRQILERAVG